MYSLESIQLISQIHVSMSRKYRSIIDNWDVIHENRLQLVKSQKYVAKMQTVFKTIDRFILTKKRKSFFKHKAVFQLTYMHSCRPSVSLTIGLALQFCSSSDLHKDKNASTVLQVATSDRQINQTA